MGTPPTEFTGREPGIVPYARLVDETAGWHRDGYNHHNMWRKNPGYFDDLADGKQSFTPPLAAHMLCYLQDMNGPGGPLLVVPGSHLSAMGDKPVGAEKEAVIQVDAKAGDVVFFHCDMLHWDRQSGGNGLALYDHPFVVRAGRRIATILRNVASCGRDSEAEARGDRRALIFCSRYRRRGTAESRGGAGAAVEAERSCPTGTCRV